MQAFCSSWLCAVAGAGAKAKIAKASAKRILIGPSIRQCCSRIELRAEPEI
jgi:hypothetical protein